MPCVASAKPCHLNDSDLLPPDTACPVCMYDGLRRPLLTLQDTPRVVLLACPCGCFSASRMPKPELLENYYASYYAATRDTATFDGSERFGVHLFGLLQSTQKKTMRILDFGGGVDAVLSRSVARQFISKGTERVEIALVDGNASCPRDWGAITVNCYRDLREAGREFGIVVASAVIEHIPDPRDVLITLLNSLRVGGSIYFRTPAVCSIARLTSRLGVTWDFTYPEHVHDMGQAFWEKVLPSLGLNNRFSLVRSRPSIVQADFCSHPIKAAIAHMLKWPWYLLRSRYTMVGGWEAVIVRMA
jgi:hypothetical protein